MKLLLHICCAPCSVACIQSLRGEGLEPTGYWYNPNIHPYTEYRARRDTLAEYAKTIGLALLMEDEYGLRPFTQAVAENIAGRCLVCYAARMRQTARFAAEHGFTHFSSTLFISPYQNHELLRAAAEQAAQEFGVAFLYRDFRPLFRQGQEEARALNLYIQKYCGCVFSEEERYSKRFRKKHRERSAANSAAPEGVEEAVAAANCPGEASIAPAGAKAAQAEADGQDKRQAAMPSLRAAGLRFEAARIAQAEPQPAQAEVPAAASPADSAVRSEADALAELTERALWEVRNVLRCAADSGLWEREYCGAPLWRHAYHMLHSLDHWFINPQESHEPAIHRPGLNNLDMAVDGPALSPLALETYLTEIAVRLRAYLNALSDRSLAACPEGSPYPRLTLMVGQMRHLHTHLGMLMGFIIAERGEWPAVLGLQIPLPTEDDGLPHYC